MSEPSSDTGTSVRGVRLWANIADFAGPSLQKGAILNWRTDSSYQRHGSAMDVPHVAHSLSADACRERREAATLAIAQWECGLTLRDGVCNADAACDCRTTADAVLAVLGLGGDDA